MKKISHIIYLLIIMGCYQSHFAQVEDDEEEEDFSIYEDYELEDDTPVKRFASPKIKGMSPRKFISLGFDIQTPYDYEFSNIRFPQENTGFDVDEDNPVVNETGKIDFTGGIRFGSNIPIISKTSFVWQSGINYLDTRYNISPDNNSPGTVTLSDGSQARSLSRILDEDGLRNFNWSNTFFFPMNETEFIVFRGQMDLSGNYSLDEFQPLNTIRYSAAVVYGRRINDYYRWGIGVARTYRVGALNYVPVIMYDWTSKNKKWGTEILFPARAYVRYNINNNTMLLGGFDLQGQSYRIDDYSINGNSFEIRRGEARPKVQLQTKVTNFVWASIEAGYRINWSYDADQLDGNNDFFRGFFGDQQFAMINDINNPFYFNISLNFVSP